MRRKVFAGIALSIILYAFFGIYVINDLPEKSEATVQNGIMTLNASELENRNIVPLVGEWSCYPNLFIDPKPDEDVFAAYADQKILVEIPKKIPDYQTDYEKGHGYATYRAVIEVPSDGLYGIKTDNIRWSYRIFINGELVAERGRIADNGEDDKATYLKASAFGKSHDGKVEIVIQVTNFATPSTGFVGPVVFGTADSVVQYEKGLLFAQSAVIAGFFVLGALSLIRFIYDRRQSYHFYFALFCISSGVYHSMIGEGFFDLLFPDLGLLAFLGIKFPLFYLMAFLYLMFLHRYFDNSLSPVWLRIHAAFLLIGTTFLILPESLYHVFSISFVTYKVLVFLFGTFPCLYIFLAAMRAFLQKKDGAEYVLIMSASFLSYALLLAFSSFLDTRIGNLPIALFIATTFAMSLMFSYQEFRLLKRSEMLSEKLIHYDQTKQSFILRTSRKIRRPIFGILNVSQALMEGREGALNIEQQNGLMTIHKEAEELSGIIEEILDAHTIQSRDLKLSFNAFGIDGLSDVIGEMQYLIPRTGDVQIINRLPETFPMLRGDENRIKQVLYSLISNAAKMTSRGEIVIGAEVVKGEALISVVDSGIEGEVLKKLISEISPVQGNESESKDGKFGIGFDICKNLIELHGGTFYIHSDYGIGTVFSFTLPLAESEAPVAENHSIKVQKAVLDRLIPGKNGLTLLIVSEDYEAIKKLSEKLNHMDYTIILVGTGERALNRLEEQKVDLVISDMVLPDMSGIEVAEHMRERFDKVMLPIFILTAAGQNQVLKNRFSEEVNDFLPKPVPFETLHEKIKSQLSIKKTVETAVLREMKVLQGQITPHFLYNTLNTIIGLSYSDENQMREALQALATYFRGKLNFEKSDEMISIEQEIELIRAYLSIEKIRFGDELNIVYDIDETVHFKLPSLTLQPLVENAIRHGILKKEGQGTIKITIKRTENGQALAIIEDDGVGMTEEKRQELLNYTLASNHIGFSNVYRKTALLNRATLALESQPDMGTRVLITFMEDEHVTGDFDR